MSTTLEALRARTKSWTEPVSADAPAGVSARFDARYEQSLGEVAKLDSPTGGAVDWKKVVETNGELLRSSTKDLLLAAHLAFGLYSLNGVDGLATGVALLGELVDRYWPSLQPELKRIRGRANAISWLVDRAGASLAARTNGVADRDALEALDTAARRLVEVVREKFGADAPALRPLTDAIERLQLSLPPEPAAPAAPADAPPTSAAPVTPTPTATPAAPQVPTTAPATPPPVFAGGADPIAFLRDFGSALASAAGEIRRADPTHPAPYRVLRTGLWLHLSAAPPSSGNKTQVPPPPAALRARFDQMAASGKWLALVEESESSLIQQRLWLDPHRVTAQALASLGPSHAAARQALIGELGAFLRRIAGLADLMFSDGTPFADAQTRTWLDAEVLAGAAVGTAGAGADDDALPQGRKLVAEGKIAEAVALLNRLAATASTAAARFRLRLDLARLLMETDQAQVARAVFGGLDEEIRARGLEEWDPGLATSCLERYLECLRVLTRLGKNVSVDTDVIYNRLCRLDPVAAARLGIDRSMG